MSAATGIGMTVSKTMTESEFTKLRAIIYDQTGISIGAERQSMLMSRLNKRLRALDLATYKEYISRVQSDPVERQELTNRVTTNETYFYRTPRIWQYFRDEVVPNFAVNGPNRPLRVWSAASSSGEEAHTAGVLLEDMRLQTPRFDYAILGTDISSRVLEMATEGHYVGRPVARFKEAEPELFARHMVGDDTNGWKVKPQIKTRIRFQQHNLLGQLMNAGQFDVVFLRNVLIYFNAKNQERILRNIHKVMHPDGILFIGESESLKHISTEFEQVAPIIYKPRTGGA
ncbi:CheR family methyltransferase [Tropicibacter naphthalenivorans]|uniref:Chemotaxis protein methyltransferase n=1 Tax=Tropicibacter naphthalenivorans TaxID=441103 RepID=A0A0P1GGK8_9RHOB|nr:protein-glutamate O-methyltransferase CheR [Tropicibacter naphthalenivorans]CUH80744.1 Chemotaxis protein methyltransferase [Tropicibacter naphthalenivorans]SMC89915.1 MCP methyltransferase, CheR-type [Tropicibacter naphthalenivorans]